jgi:hypothetical protein
VLYANLPALQSICEKQGHAHVNLNLEKTRAWRPPGVLDGLFFRKDVFFADETTFFLHIAGKAKPD